MGFNKVGIILAAAAVLLVSSGCSAWNSDHTKQPIDPPQDEADVTMERAVSGGQNSEIKQEAKPMQVTMYFKDPSGLVSPLSLTMPASQSVAKLSLESMAEDGMDKSMLPKGFTSLLPKGTKVNLNISNKLAIADFSKEFLNYNPQDERKIMEAVTWTLTGFPSIEKVQIRVEGNALKEMPVDATPLDEPLSRAMGINLELSPGIEPGRSAPVTVFYRNRTDDQFTYFVPVTRLIPRTDDLPKAALQELIKGPKQDKELLPALASDVEVIKVNLSDDKSMVLVDFNSKFLDKDKKAAAEALQAVILSLTENTGVNKVQISVNGDIHVKSSDDKGSGRPVTRPVYINPVPN